MNKGVIAPITLKYPCNRLYYHATCKYIISILLIINVGFSLGMPYDSVTLTTTSVIREADSLASSDQTSLHSSRSVGDLLASLFKQTIYNRIENLLLDPGRPSPEKQKIIDSAVHNYHNQKYLSPLHPTNEKAHLVPSDETISSESKISKSKSSNKVARSSNEREILSGSEDKGVDISSLAGKLIKEI